MNNIMKTISVAAAATMIAGLSTLPVEANGRVVAREVIVKKHPPKKRKILIHCPRRGWYHEHFPSQARPYCK